LDAAVNAELFFFKGSLPSFTGLLSKPLKLVDATKSSNTSLAPFTCRPFLPEITCPVVVIALSRLSKSIPKPPISSPYKIRLSNFALAEASNSSGCLYWSPKLSISFNVLLSA
jgi:hypothetical protein